MIDLIMLMYQMTVIILLGLECWLLWFFSREHTLMLDLIKHNLGEIRQDLQHK
jgi:hypothetical protein